MAPTNFAIAAYLQGMSYPGNNLRALTPLIQNGGWNTIIFGLFHIGRTTPPPKTPQILGDIYFNDTLIISEGNYVGDSAWPAAVNNLVGGNVTKLLASFGGAAGWVYDFGTIEQIYKANGNSFNGTNLQRNLLLFRTLFPAITTIDMDNEDNYDVPSFVAFCQLVIGMGFTVTFCPYQSNDFWTSSLAQLQRTNPGAVIWWNLQCYAGGQGNDPATWAGYIQQAIPGFDTSRYILASDWTRFWSNGWGGDCPSNMQSLLSGFKTETCIGGAFIWTLDQIFQFNTSSVEHSGSGCNSTGGSQSAYVSAITNGLLVQEEK